MKVTIVTSKNNEVESTSRMFNTELEIRRMKMTIRARINNLKKAALRLNSHFEEIIMDGVRGFISDHLQVIETENNIDLTYGGKHVQFIFSPSYETTTATLAA